VTNTILDPDKRVATVPDKNKSTLGRAMSPLRCNNVYFDSSLLPWRYVMLPSSGLQIKPRKDQAVRKVRLPFLLLVSC
jgi:hypothetical protein